MRLSLFPLLLSILVFLFVATHIFYIKKKLFKQTFLNKKLWNGHCNTCGENGFETNESGGGRVARL